MITEIVIFICVCFFLSVWFYKQRRSSLELLQVEYSAIQEKLKPLAEEKQPIIIRGVPVPQILTREKLAGVPRLQEFPLRAGPDAPTLRQFREAPNEILPEAQRIGIPILNSTQSAELAQELALPTWTTHTLSEMLYDFTGFLSPVTSFETNVVLGGQGLRRGLSTRSCILPVEGAYIVSVLSKGSETFLPPGWTWRYPTTLSVNDTPLVAELKFIDVIVRPGTMICIPAHTIYSVMPKEDGYATAITIDIDTPISRLSKFLEALQN